MERRRPRLDPLLVDQVNERLAFVLADRAPRRAQPSMAAAATGRDAPPDPAAEPDRTLELGPVDDLPPARHFDRRHLGVLAVLVVLGLLVGGWSLLRARPVAVASPEVVVSTPVPSAGGPAASSSASSSTPELVVHVLGAVKRPGLVHLPAGSRVQDAIAAAGGLTKSADPGELNLAQALADGQQIVIGHRGDPVGEVRDGGGGPDPSGGSTSGATLDLNRATEAQLEQLPGVGPVTAGKIAGWRTAHSRFSRVEELQEVDGIGPKTYAQIAPHVRV